MSRMRCRGAIAGLSLALAMATTSLPTFAHGQGHGVAGKITNVSATSAATSVTVQTSTGAVTEQLTSSTIVVKVTRGTLADLTPGAFAQVTLASGSNTVTAIHVESKTAVTTHTPRAGTKPATGTIPKPHATKPKTGTTAPKAPRVNAGLHRGGQIVSAGNGSLTLSTRQGQTTYTLGQNVTVTKTVRGALSDLQIGQTVRIAVRPGSTTAFAVTIESA